MANKKTAVFFILGMILFFSVSLAQIVKASPSECVSRQNQLNILMGQVATCNQDSDCAFEAYSSCYIGASNSPCGIVKNKNADLSQLKQLINQFGRDCMTECPGGGCNTTVPETKCVSGICKISYDVAANQTCASAGQEGNAQSKQCCSGLKSVDINQAPIAGTCPVYDVYIFLTKFLCIKINDGICGAGENKCTSPADCGSLPTQSPAPTAMRTPTATPVLTPTASPTPNFVCANSDCSQIIQNITSHGRLFFLIPVDVVTQITTDAQTGMVISIRKPWWSFLVWWF